VRLPLLVLLLAVLGLTAAPVDAASPPFKWMPDNGANVRVDGNLMMVRSGIVLGNLAVGDVSLKFDARVPATGASGRVILHTLIKGGVSFQPFPLGYSVELSESGAAAGRITSRGSRMRELAFRQSADSAMPGTFQTYEVRVEHHDLRVFIDGTLVSHATDLDQFAGYIGFEAAGGRGVEIRDARVARLPAHGDPFAQGVPHPGAGVTLPRLVEEFRPFYTVEAMAAHVTGRVMLEAVVLEDGSVGEVRVVRSLDCDLDESAVGTLRRWRFSPATKLGVPTAVVITAELAFSLAP